MKFFLNIIFLLNLFILNLYSKEDNFISKEEKILYLNLTTTGLLMAYGMEHWGYDILHTRPHAQSEGWFEKNSKHGGADKFGHAYVGYLSGHLFSYAYEDWGYSHEEAALYGAYSSFLFTTIMEIGDSFSNFGLSYEDMVANTFGAVFGYYTYKYENLKDLIDFRVEYKIRKDSYDDDFSTDYENLKYLFAIKASGIDKLKKSYLKYIEFYLIYDINGYEVSPYLHERNLIFGFGVNLSKLFDSKIFNYYQVPDIYLSKDLKKY